MSSTSTIALGSPNFPSIDSWVLIQPDPPKSSILHSFQITINVEKHDAEGRDLNLVDKLATNAPMTPRYLVIITPTGVKDRD
jgi:hypothetical protein